MSSLAPQLPQQQTVLPGDILGAASEFDSGAGTYTRGEHVRAAVLGQRSLLPISLSGKTATLAVIRTGASMSAQTIEAGSVVLCKVLRITQLAAYVDIIVCDGLPLPHPLSGVIRKESVRDLEVDKVNMEECFRPMDIVQASVASLGDARSYYLSTAAPEHGVVLAKSEQGLKLLPLSYSEMVEDREDGAVEKRKVAKPAQG